MTMNVKFLNPFLEAIYEVLKTETGIEAKKGELQLDKGPYTTDDITVIIALVGSVEGMVFYSLTERTSIGLVSKMMGEELSEFDSLAQSGIAELGNVITGRASVKLSLAGYEATISPPTLIIGKGSQISTLDFPRLVVPLSSTLGTITVHIALREGINQSQKTSHIPVPAKPSI
jgi:chemotaxis protein CheX